ncbi:MAG: DUF3179 domain-containing (seleno)protein [Candidatus Eisenbacteria bacterium]
MPPSPSRRFTFRSGGWVLGAAVLLVFGAVAWRMVDLIGSGSSSRAIGDGKDPATYRFDLSNARAAPGAIAAAGIPRDGVRVLDLPRVVTLAGVDSIEEARRRGRFLVSADRIVGVTIAGRSRAYPVRLLNWHEIVNDTLAGRPIAVTWSPLAGAAVVLDRSRGAVGTVPTAATGPRWFGVSGLLWQSSLLMYDRETESLWSPLVARAIAGRQVGESLDVLPSSYETWAEWRMDHPATTVLAPLPELQEAYDREPYGSYEGSDLLRFPVDPLPAREGGRPWKEVVLAVRFGTEWRPFSMREVREKAGPAPAGTWDATIGGRQVRFTIGAEPPTMRVAPIDGGPDLPSFLCYWFAWYATHPARPGGP